MVHESIFMSGGKTIPWVRVPGHDHAAIGYALDAGASLVIPQVETVEQCRHVLSSAKFGTRQNGTRSAPPFRFVPGVTDHPFDSTRDLHKCLNDQAAVMIQIESLEGVRNLDAILTACPDVDLVWFGSLDCRVSMNLPGNFGLGGDEPEWKEAAELFESTMKKHDKPRGGFAFAGAPFGTPEGLTKAAEYMSFMGVSADVLHLWHMAQDLSQARELTALPTKVATNGSATTQNGVNSAEGQVKVAVNEPTSAGKQTNGAAV
jgi:4-hydroxy-2-oxoheptanedioate aldolase